MVRSLSRPLERKVLAALVSPLLVLVVAVLAFRGVEGVRETQNWVSHTREVIDILQRIQISLVDGETEERAYLITHDQRYLETYQAAGRRTQTLLGMLMDQVSDNQQQGLRAKSVRLAANAKLEQLQGAVNAFETQGPDMARTVILSGHGRETMEEVRRVIGDMIRAERDLLVSRTNERDHVVTYTTWVIAAGSVVAILLAVLVNVGIRHDITIQRRNQALLEEQAARLEAQRNSLEESERKLAHQLEAERSLSDRLAAASAAAENALAERNAANAALERSNRELNQFAYVASHDLKAPLRGIANLAQWVEEDVGKAMTDDSREHIRVLLSRVRRMESLIDGILAYARAGKSGGEREEIDVGQLVHDVLELIAPPAGAVRIDVAHELPKLRAERAPFQQIWMNLLGNAFKHARREGAEVTVRAQDRGGEWEFQVADNGPGIAPQYQQRIFGIFQTLASRDRVEGTGIGLATVKKLVETEGGRVWVESQVGQGATFRFTWPKLRERS
jgi:signal transduction histidine kinase